MAINPYGARASKPTGDTEPGSGLTKKQTDMAQTRNPYGIVMNAPKAPTMGVEQQTQSPYEQKQKMEGQSKQYQQNKATTESNQQMNELNARLGQGALEIQAAVNKFLATPTQAADIRGTNTASFDPVAKQWNVATAIDDTNKLNPLIAEKTAQQAAITGTQAFEDIWGSDPTTGEMTPISYQDYIKKQVASGAIGGFNEVGKDAKVNHMMQLVAQLNALDNAGMADSPQYTAIQNMITREDDQGLVAGMIQAKQKFNRLTGKDDYGKRLTYSGDEGGTEYTVGDIGGMKLADISKEVEQGVLNPASTGLFSGDWGATTRQEVDTESAEYKAAAEHEKKMNQEVYTAGKAWADKWATDLQAKANEIMPKLKAIAPKIKEELEKQGAIGAEGIAWFEAVSKGDLVTTLTNAVLDPTSGLLPEQRKLLGKYLGDLLGDPSYVQKGQLATWMDQLNTKGFFLAEDGTTKVRPNAQQKAELLNILYNPGLADDVKQTRIREEFKKIASQQQTSLDAVMTSVNAGIATLPEAVATAVNANVATIASYSGSILEDLARDAYGLSNEEWAKMDQTKRAQSVAGLIKANPNIVREVQEQGSQTLKDRYAAATASKQRAIDARKAEVTAALANAQTELSRIPQSTMGQEQMQQARLNADYYNSAANLQETATQLMSMSAAEKAAAAVEIQNLRNQAKSLTSEVAANETAIAKSAEIAQVIRSAASETSSLDEQKRQVEAAAAAFNVQLGSPTMLMKANLALAKKLNIMDIPDVAATMGSLKGFDKGANYITLNQYGQLPEEARAGYNAQAVTGRNYGQEALDASKAAIVATEQAKQNAYIEQAVPAVPTPVAPATPAAPPSQQPSALDRFDTGNYKSRDPIAPRETPVDPFNAQIFTKGDMASEGEKLNDELRKQSERNKQTMNEAEEGMTEDNKNRLKEQYTPAEIREGLSPKEQQAADNIAQEKANAERSIYDKIMGKQAVPTEQQKNDALYDVAADRATRSQLGTSPNDRNYGQPGMTPEEQKLYEQALKGGADGAVEADKVNKAASEKQQKEAKENAASERADRDAERKEMQSDRSGKVR